MQPFKGDDPADFAAIANAGYRPFVVPATLACARACGLELSPETVARIRRGYPYAFYLDDLIDSAPKKGPEAVRQAHSVFHRLVTGEDPRAANFPGVREDLLAAARLANNSWSGMDRRHFIEPATGIAYWALRKARARNVWFYALGLIIEGRICAGLVGACMTQVEHDSRRARAFQRWWRDAMAFAVIYDGVVDLGKDYENLLSQVRPNRANKCVMWLFFALTAIWLWRRPKVLWVTALAGRRLRNEGM